MSLSRPAVTPQASAHEKSEALVQDTKAHSGGYAAVQYSLPSTKERCVPTLHGIHLPQPAHWQEFEQITLDALRLKWRSPNLQKNGREGQAQNGVDIHGVDELGRPVGIQCKNTTKALALKTLTAEIKNADGFPGPLTTLYVATTAPPDQVLQTKVRTLSHERAMQGKFAVGLLYWEDIYAGLVLDRTVLANHYPDFIVPGAVGQNGTTGSKLSALLVGYFGSHLWAFIELTFGEMGQLAHMDPEQVRTTLHRIRNNLAFASSTDREDLTEWLIQIEAATFCPDASRQWDEVKWLARRIEQRVVGLSSLVDGLDITNFIEIGISLGVMYHGNGKFTERHSDIAYRQVRTVLPDSESRLVEKLKQLRNAQRYNAAPALYSFICRELRWPLPPPG